MQHEFSYAQTPTFSGLIESIVERVKTEKIFLLATCIQRYYAENIFTNLPVEWDQPAHDHLLVIAAENEQRSNSELQHIAENQCGLAGGVIVFVIGIHEFNKWLMDGHPFAFKVYNRAQLCYDAKTVPLAIPNHTHPDIVHEHLHHYFCKRFSLAAGFMCAAELFTLRKEFAMAAFNLHQAAEQLYSGIICLITGLRVQTHNIDKLYRYSIYLLAGLPAIFPRDTETEKRLFSKLQKAYLETRYKQEYSIKGHEINILTTRIHKIIQLCQPLKNSMQPIF